MFYKLLQHIGNLKHNIVLNDFHYVKLLLLCLKYYLIGQNIKDFLENKSEDIVITSPLKALLRCINMIKII